MVGLRRSSGSGSAKTWEDVLEKITPAVVELRVDYVRAFDHQPATNGVGTGFVVDKKNGYILTNRHIVTLGPITAQAVFTNKKRITVTPVYRDPIHDFGFFKYDPKDIDYDKLVEIKLAPEEAKVGLDFRMIGSGESEQNSIVVGTLARLDREAPRYKSYMDFNTYYFSAVSSAKQGSSGSPVLARSGNAVALNCGGSQGSSSFFLPLERIVYALKCLQGKKKVHRGTVLSVFKHEDFDDVRALGLSENDEKTIRSKFPEATGMLTVKQTVPDGPADRAGLRPGDAVLSVEGKSFHDMLTMQEFLDSTEVDKLDFSVSRGGKQVDLSVELEDMYNVTPSKYLEVGDAVLNPVGFIWALRMNIPTGGVMVADPGYMFRHAHIPAGAVITSVDGKATPDLDTFEEIVSQYPNQSELLVKYMIRRNTETAAVVVIDRLWYPMRTATINNETGLWDFKDSKAPDSKMTKQGLIQEKDLDLKSVISKNVTDSMVSVEFRTPYSIQGNLFSKTTGVGVIVNLARGLIVCPRTTVFSHLGDAEISINSLLQIPAHVVFMHPTYSFSILQFNPALLIGKEVKVSEARDLVKDKFTVGSKAIFYGMTVKQSKILQQCSVISQESPYFGHGNPPRFIQKNQEFLNFDQTNSLYSSKGGLFLSQDNKIGAFWMQLNTTNPRETEFGAVPAHIVIDCVKWLEGKVKGKSARGFSNIPVRSLGVSLQTVPLGKVRNAIGISDEWVKKFAAVDTQESRQILTIKSTMVGTAPADVLKQGEFILAVDEKPIVSFEAFEEAMHEKENVTVTVQRDRKPVKLKVPTLALTGFSIDRVVFFAGLILHPTFDDIRYLQYIPKEIKDGGVYLAGLKAGSPAARAGLMSNGWITKVKNVPTPDLDTFLEEIQKLNDQEYVNIELHMLNGAVKVSSIRNDFHYWGASQLVRSPSGNWERESL